MAAAAAELALPVLGPLLGGLFSSMMPSGGGIRCRKGKGAPAPATIATPYGGRIDPMHLARHALRAAHAAHKLYSTNPAVKSAVNSVARKGVNMAKAKISKKLAKGKMGGRSHAPSKKSNKKAGAVTPGPLP